MNLPTTDDFHSIVINETPLLDVRAPVEFENGAFSNATNLAILDDEQRRLVGIRYKERGNESAIKLGEELVEKEERIAKWKEYLKENPNALLYCFRGGQRSGISQAWLSEAGIEITRLKGGYKAFRQYLMDQTLEISAKTNTFILGGRTGSGKTLLLPFIENSIDLEGLANHRGSSFGSFISPQPTQINFENDLAYELIRFDAKDYKNLVIEHESHNIGRAFIPKPVYDNFMKGRLVILETPLDARIDITYEEYVTSAIKDYVQKYGEEGLAKWADSINAAFNKIKKRLGSESHLKLKTMFDEAYSIHAGEAGENLHKKWIEELLTGYYDPMYDYQLEKSPIPVIFRGDSEEVLSFLRG